MSQSKARQAVLQYEAAREDYQTLAEKAAGAVRELLGLGGIAVQGIESRAKTIASFREKLERKSYEAPLVDVTDLAGIRIICYVESDVRRVCDVVEDAFDVDATNSADKTDELGTDKVGYRSVHFIAKFSSERLVLPEYQRFEGMAFEVQVRTILQHAWAEIEHDRNYKFAGVLPNDVRRRFALIAGVLELADREFDAIAKEIDRYAAAVSEQTEAGDLAIDLTTSAIREYLSKVFESQVAQGLSRDFGAQSDELIDELHAFGVSNLQDLDSLIPEDVRLDHSEWMLENNFIGLLRDMMMMTDAERYFSDAWQGHWQGMDESQFVRLEEHGVDIGALVTQYDLDVL